MPASAQLLQLRADLVDQLDPVRRSDKAVKIILRELRRAFAADAVCVAVCLPGGGVELRYQAPREASLDVTRLAGIDGERRPKLPTDLMAAPLQRRGRTWGFLVLRRESAPFRAQERRDLVAAGDFASRQLQRVDRLRSAEVRERIDRKIQEQLRPEDLFYQLLHGLRSLTRYDHSAAVLIFDEGSSSLRLAAEQIAWRKAKSGRVGARLALDDDTLGLLESGRVRLLRRAVEGEPFVSRDGLASDALAQRLHALRANGGSAPQQVACSLLVAPLVARDRLLGVLELASCHADSLGPWEMDLVRRFLPQAAVAVANLDRAASLEQGLLQAERKHVMAELARGVSHDVNNALGSVLPLVQQMAEDLRGGSAKSATLLEDLAQVEAAVQVCRRIFSGMLAFGQGTRAGAAQTDVTLAVRSALSVLEESLRRQEITLQLDLPDVLPRVRGSRGDLEQVVLNLAGNARDAMPTGGVLGLTAVARPDHVVIVVSDTGRGIAPDMLTRVSEPFFTTKRHGNGLGLSICQSIVWTMGGSLKIKSQPDVGTTVTVELPLAEVLA